MANEKLQLSEQIIHAGPGQKNVTRSKFINGFGEVIVHMSNFSNEAKYFNVNVEEVDHEGNPIAESVKEEGTNNSENIQQAGKEPENIQQIPADKNDPKNTEMQVGENIRDDSYER